MRVCQIRHDGNRINLAAAARKPPNQEDQPSYFTDTTPPVKPRGHRFVPSAQSQKQDRTSSSFEPLIPDPWPLAPDSYPSFAVIEIFAFSTFDTGHPFSAASAYF